MAKTSKEEKEKEKEKKNKKTRVKKTPKKDHKGKNTYDVFSLEKMLDENGVEVVVPVVQEEKVTRSNIEKRIELYQEKIDELTATLETIQGIEDTEEETPVE